MSYTEKQIRKMILDYLIKNNLENDDEPEKNETYQSYAESCYYSVVENYMPDCPGWCGDILTVVYGGSEESVEFFRIDDNKLDKITPEV